MSPDEILNKIWNPDLPVVLIDPPLEPKDIELIRRSLFIFSDARVAEPNLIKHANPNILMFSAACVTRWAAESDRYLSRSVYGSACYLDPKETPEIIPVYFLGFRFYSQHHTADARYCKQCIDGMELTHYMQLTADLIKTSY